LMLRNVKPQIKAAATANREARVREVGMRTS